MPRRQKTFIQRIERVSSLVVEWATTGLLFLAPLFFIPILSSRNGAKLSLILAGMLMILGVATVKAWTKREIEFRVPWVFVGIGLLIAASAVSLASVANIGFALSSLMLLGLFGLFGLVVSRQSGSERSLKCLLGALLAAGGVAACIAVLQYIGYLGDPMGSPLDRALATFGNRNFLGSFLGVMALPSLGLLLKLRQTRIWYVAWSASALCFLGPLLVQQTGMLMALLAGIGFVSLGVVVFGVGRHIRTHHREILVVSLAAILGLGLGLGLWRSSPSEEMVDASETGLWTANSGYTREVDWWTAWEMLKANPLTGVGLGNYKVEFLDYKALFLSGPRGSAYSDPVIRAEQAHNDFVQIAAELGIPGVGAMIGLILLTIWSSWIRCRSIPSEARRLEFLLILAGVVVASVHALVSFPFHLPITALTVVAILGLSSSSYFGERATIHGHVVGVKARGIVLAGFLLLCLLGIVLGREFFAQVSYSQGLAQMESGENAQAQLLFEKSIAASVNSSEAKFQLANVALLRSDQALKLGDTEYSTDLLEIAWANIQLGQEAYPTEQGLLLLAGIAVRLNEDAIAETTVSRLLASRPWSVFEQGGRYLLAALDARGGDLEASKRALLSLIQDYPEYIQSYILLGQLLAQSGKAEDGRKILEEGMQAVEGELLRIEDELKTATTRSLDSLVFDRQRLLLERQVLVALLEDL